jgi:hypothetical protein
MYFRADLLNQQLADSIVCPSYACIDISSFHRLAFNSFFILENKSRNSFWHFNYSSKILVSILLFLNELNTPSALELVPRYHLGP